MLQHVNATARYSLGVTASRATLPSSRPTSFAQFTGVLLLSSLVHSRSNTRAETFSTSSRAKPTSTLSHDTKRFESPFPSDGSKRGHLGGYFEDDLYFCVWCWQNGSDEASYVTPREPQARESLRAYRVYPKVK